MFVLIVRRRSDPARPAAWRYLEVLTAQLNASCTELTLQPTEWFYSKIIQLKDTIGVRHGLMLVGPTGGGKTMNYRLLSLAITTLAAPVRKTSKGSLDGEPAKKPVAGFEKVPPRPRNLPRTSMLSGGGRRFRVLCKSC